MSVWYYYDESGQKIRINSDAELKKLAATGKIQFNTFVEHESGKSVPAGKINGLKFDQIQPTETPRKIETLEETYLARANSNETKTTSPVSAKYQEGIPANFGFKVLEGQIQIQNISYATRNISSVRIDVRNVKSANPEDVIKGALFFGVLGGILIYCGQIPETDDPFSTIGFIATVIGGLFAVLSLMCFIVLLGIKETTIYSVIMTTNAGEQNILETENSNHAHALLESIKEAISKI
ncbi:MAG: DUF6232 family protein [Planctomycetaceae bacterium]|jgi:hypothetical protein|nr:DUF6232 family protein [Planctomycetaceae bacterium]